MVLCPCPCIDCLPWAPCSAYCRVEKGTGNLYPSSIIIKYIRGMGTEADRLLRRIAERMSIRRGDNYSSVVSFHRRGNSTTTKRYLYTAVSSSVDSGQG